MPQPAPSLLSRLADPGFVAFWTERHLCTLTTLRPDGSPHVVAVGATLDPEAGVARIITRRGSRKVANIEAAGPDGARVAVCQHDGRRFSTLEGVAHVRRDPESVAEAVRRYAERYRQPEPNPERVAVEIVITRVLGHV